MRFLIGRYHEVALKGRNRWRFVDQLKRNLRAVFADFRIDRIRSEGPRLIVGLPDDLGDETVGERAAFVFGFENFTISRALPLDLEIIKREAVAAAHKVRPASFRVRTRRVDKRFPLNSMDVDREVGREVKETLGIRVDLEEPELTITIELLPNVAYLAVRKYRGAGGLPVGISGHGIALLSGGIDSPVAAYRMMRRGLRLGYVHFHSHPLLPRTSQEKARELVSLLSRYQPDAMLMLVAFGDLQREIVAHTLRPLRVVLYRRFMLRIASTLAAKLGATALVTGESLGQVASQTLANMAAIENAAALPIMRPLVGMDKNEIIEQARRLGSFEISIIPDADCCTLFVPLHPETHANLEDVEKAESVFDIPGMVEEAVAKTEYARISFSQTLKSA